MWQQHVAHMVHVDFAKITRLEDGDAAQRVGHGVEQVVSPSVVGQEMMSTYAESVYRGGIVGMQFA